MGGVDEQCHPLSPCEKVVHLPALYAPSDKEKDVFPVEEENCSVGNMYYNNTVALYNL